MLYIYPECIQKIFFFKWIEALYEGKWWKVKMKDEYKYYRGKKNTFLSKLPAEKDRSAAFHRVTMGSAFWSRLRAKHSEGKAPTQRGAEYWGRFLLSSRALLQKRHAHIGGLLSHESSEHLSACFSQDLRKKKTPSGDGGTLGLNTETTSLLSNMTHRRRSIMHLFNMYWFVYHTFR